MADYPLLKSFDQDVSKKYYRFLKTPEENWQPFGDTVSYVGHPYIDPFDTAEFLSTPREGHYLVVASDGSFSFNDPGHLEFYNLVGYTSMPPLQELLEKGIVVETPEAIRKVDFDIQDKMFELSMDLMDEHSAIRELEGISLERRFLFPTKEAREANRKITVHEENIKSINKELDALDFDLNEKVRKPLLSFVKSQSERPTLKQLIDRAEEQSSQRKPAPDVHIQSASTRNSESHLTDKAR